jgi:hypothetical protein
MKVIKTASGKNQIKMSRSEWENMGKKAGWMKTADYNWWETSPDDYTMEMVRYGLNKYLMKIRDTGGEDTIMDEKREELVNRLKNGVNKAISVYDGTDVLPKRDSWRDLPL